MAVILTYIQIFFYIIFSEFAKMQLERIFIYMRLLMVLAAFGIYKEGLLHIFFAMMFVTFVMKYLEPQDKKPYRAEVNKLLKTVTDLLHNSVMLYAVMSAVREKDVDFVKAHPSGSVPADAHAIVTLPRDQIDR